MLSQYVVVSEILRWLGWFLPLVSATKSILYGRPDPCSRFLRGASFCYWLALVGYIVFYTGQLPDYSSSWFLFGVTLWYSAFVTGYVFTMLCGIRRFEGIFGIKSKIVDYLLKIIMTFLVAGRGGQNIYLIAWFHCQGIADAVGCEGINAAKASINNFDTVIMLMDSMFTFILDISFFVGFYIMLYNLWLSYEKLPLRQRLHLMLSGRSKFQIVLYLTFCIFFILIIVQIPVHVAGTGENSLAEAWIVCDSINLVLLLEFGTDHQRIIEEFKAGSSFKMSMAPATGNEKPAV